MSIITLTTDFGNKDFFVSSVKGAILSEVKNAMIIDVSNEIQPYNHSEAAYILKNAYKTFPKGTIHIVGVESELTPENRHIAMVFEGHYFIGSDNGIFSMIKDDLKAEKIVEINIHEKESSSFSVLDVFVKVAAHISRMGKLEVIGKNFEERFLLLIHCGDWLSYWCAILHKIDPSPVKNIDILKNKLLEIK